AGSSKALAGCSAVSYCLSQKTSASKGRGPRGTGRRTGKAWYRRWRAYIKRGWPRAADPRLPPLEEAEVMRRHRQPPRTEGAPPRAGYSETVVFVTLERATTLPRRAQAITRLKCAPVALWIRRRVR